jgi:uncharacterized protein YbbC (DUF1343 family)
MVVTGLERLLENTEILAHRKIGLIANHTSLTRDFNYSWDLLRKEGVVIEKLFSPEHGLFGTEQDQAPAKSMPGLPFEVVSLYGDSYVSLSPSAEHVSALNCIIFDIQDIGTRYYTYSATMAMFLRSLHGKDIEFIVLDRPNPLGGRFVEGPVIKKGFESFVGALPVPVRHGLTVGEMARMAVDYYDLDVNLKVIELKGWKRSMFYGETGLPWVPPSPNMPSLNTAFIYPGACLFEGTNVSEGRGTTNPFEVIGAPGVRPYELAEKLNGLGLSGVFFRPVFFRPTFNKYAGETIGGVCVHITDYILFRPFLTGMAMVSAFREMMPGFTFTTGSYEFNSAHPAFDLLTGSATFREMILEGTSFDAISAMWEKEENVAGGIMREIHIY